MTENDWRPLPLDKALFANVAEDAVTGFQTAIENGFVNELGGHTRFPGFALFCTLDDNGRVFLTDFNGDLIAATSKGRLYRIDQAANVEAIDGVSISGGRRVIFAPTDRELLMAAGGPIVRFRNHRTEILSAAAPNSTHVGWIDGYTLAIEIDSGRFFHSGPGTPDQWDPLDVFAADGNPDNINSLLITPYREIMLGGPDSIEQFERLPTGQVPFFRRWSIGDGVKFPYVMLFADNAMWCINQLNELVRQAGQQSQAHSDEIGKLIEGVDDWRDAWLGGYPDRPLHTAGQKFMVLQAPYASNVYGTKGLTLLYDYRQKKFSTLWGWDEATGVPTRWPGWSHWTLWNKTFIGGEGKIYRLAPPGPDGAGGQFTHAGALQRWLIRTAHMAKGEGATVENFRLRLTRGHGTPQSAPMIRVRCSRDGRPFGPWIKRSLGRAGDRLQFIQFGSFGSAQTFQWEISTADDCPINLIGADVIISPLG